MLATTSSKRHEMMEYKTHSAERTGMRLGTIDLIRKIGLDPNDVMLIRHSTAITRKYVNQGFLDECTAEMKPKFTFGQTHRYWMVFAGEQSTTRLVALYRMDGWTKLEKGMLPDGYPIEESNYGKNDFYILERLDLLAEYENRLTIDWGSFRSLAWKGTVDKPIVSIERTKPTFPGFDDLILGFDKLSDIIEDPDYYSAYYDAMSQVSAIYLVTDTASGKQYVGSAYGGEGLWQRWSTYAHTQGRGGSGDGGNKLLVDLLNRGGEGYERNLRYSVLRVLDSGLSTDQVVGMENLYKDKLGTREFGLNAN
ncbi:GIY-YIG nuclease family protein [Bifidobacterium sp. SO4]|uniref:GIY-YIG nuclease family protein n=1 Tax=Bifidobacterium sp. SO4 TaxID=2809030 RepID=UPI001BDBBB11|nr:GIY-YIG nuclease family protein [Bifidobacterium sp. SO4]MBT1171233.1 GIY-YIG nuclease family protein [Bifidobacterium sp. SO4]